MDFLQNQKYPVLAVLFFFSFYLAVLLFGYIFFSLLYQVVIQIFCFFYITQEKFCHYVASPFSVQQVLQSHSFFSSHFPPTPQYQREEKFFKVLPKLRSLNLCFLLNLYFLLILLNLYFFSYR